MIVTTAVTTFIRVANSGRPSAFSPSEAIEFSAMAPV